MRIFRRPLPFVDRLRRRRVGDVRTLVVHATEEPDLEDARRLAENSADHVSAHFYIDRSGLVEEWVPITRVADHVAGQNHASIGVELVNLGRFPDHYSSTAQVPTEPFREEQIAALEDLITELRRRCPHLDAMKAHSDLDSRTIPASDDPAVLVRRRIDPGPLFPWERVARHFSGAR